MCNIGENRCFQNNHRKIKILDQELFCWTILWCYQLKSFKIKYLLRKIYKDCKKSVVQGMAEITSRNTFHIIVRHLSQRRLHLTSVLPLCGRFFCLALYKQLLIETDVYSVLSKHEIESFFQFSLFHNLYQFFTPKSDIVSQLIYIYFSFSSSLLFFMFRILQEYFA